MPSWGVCIIHAGLSINFRFSEKKIKNDKVTLVDDSAEISSKSYTSTRPMYFLQKVRQIGLNFRLREIRDLVVLVLRRNRSVSFGQAFL